MSQNSQKILMVGRGRDAYDLAQALRHIGADITKVEGFQRALEEIEREAPEALLVVLPVSWEKAITFVKGVREQEAFKELPIIYISAVVEGIDQLELKKYNVHTFSLGPIPIPEMARYIMEQVL